MGINGKITIFLTAWTQTKLTSGSSKLMSCGRILYVILALFQLSYPGNHRCNWSFMMRRQGGHIPGILGDFPERGKLRLLCNLRENWLCTLQPCSINLGAACVTQSMCSQVSNMGWLAVVIIFLPCGFLYLLFFFPWLISAVAELMSTILLHMVCLSANLGCRSQMCCTQISGNTVRKTCHLGTNAQLCWSVTSRLRHVSTIQKNLLSSNTSSTCPHNMVNFGPLTAEIGSGVWGTPTNFNGFRVLAALLHATLVVIVSQTLRWWTEGATYIWQGGHHVGHWPTF